MNRPRNGFGHHIGYHNRDERAAPRIGRVGFHWRELAGTAPGWYQLARVNIRENVAATSLSSNRGGPPRHSTNADRQHRRYWLSPSPSSIPCILGNACFRKGSRALPSDPLDIDPNTSTYREEVAEKVNSKRNNTANRARHRAESLLFVAEACLQASTSPPFWPVAVSYRRHQIGRWSRTKMVVVDNHCRAKYCDTMRL